MQLEFRKNNPATCAAWTVGERWRCGCVTSNKSRFPQSGKWGYEDQDRIGVRRHAIQVPQEADAEMKLGMQARKESGIGRRASELRWA